MIKTILISLFVLVGAAMPVAVQAQAPANPLEKACSEVKGEDKPSSCTEDGKQNPLYGSNGIINNVANGVALVAGAVAVVFITLGGLRMITSTGDAQAFKEARSTLIYGAVGLIVVSFARAIVGFVLGRLA